MTDQGSLEIEVPRDRDSSFEPQLIKKGERRFSGFDDKIIAMYARGMTVREIQGYLEGMYGVVVSPDLRRIFSVLLNPMVGQRHWLIYATYPHHNPT